MITVRDDAISKCCDSPRTQCGRRVWVLVAMVLALSWGGGTCAADSKPPRLFVVGKTVNYRQAADGALTLINYHFFAEIFLASGGESGVGELVDPSGRVMRFQAEEGVLRVPGKRFFSSLVDLDTEAPDGSYTVQFEAPELGAITGTIALRARSQDMADPVHITLFQDDKSIPPSAVDPGKALTIGWTPFRKGRSDPNGISDDLIFVHVGDCRGKMISRSPPPFVQTPALTYRARSYTVAPGAFVGGATYQISVEHAPVVTRMIGGVPALATYPATTYLDVHTQGSGTIVCPDPPYRMDPGQSDRMLSPTPEQGQARLAAPQANRITDQVTFLYYEDLAAARRFYCDTLGFTPYYENEWVSLLHTTTAATIGLVKLEHTNPAISSKRAVVMVSLVTDDAAGWYERLRQDPNVHIVKGLYDHPRVPIRAFELEDPAGYPVEFFQWLTAPGTPKGP
jgi:catechol 2,3-dioxygenase-like lactoylglutathione lyase family enzyme